MTTGPATVTSPDDMKSRMPPPVVETVPIEIPPAAEAVSPPAARPARFAARRVRPLSVSSGSMASPAGSTTGCATASGARSAKAAAMRDAGRSAPRSASSGSSSAAASTSRSSAS